MIEQIFPGLKLVARTAIKEVGQRSVLIPDDFLILKKLHDFASAKTMWNVDDALDVVGVHCVGGTWGAIATGLFASKAVNPAGNNGLFYGNASQLGIQLIGVIATLVFCFVGAFVLLKLTDALVGLRVVEEDEFVGLDLSQHSENAYVLGTITTGEATREGFRAHGGM